MRQAVRLAVVFMGVLFCAVALYDVGRTLLFTSPQDRMAHFKMGGWLQVAYWRATVFFVAAFVLALFHFLAALQAGRRGWISSDHPLYWSAVTGVVSAGLFWPVVAIPTGSFLPMDYGIVRIVDVLVFCIIVAFLPSILIARFLPHRRSTASPLAPANRPGR